MIYHVQKQVASDIFEEEVVVVDLAQGNYFSIQGGGLFLWKLLQQGVDFEVFKQEVRTRYGAEESLLEAFDQHIETLKTEKLVEPIQELTTDGDKTPSAAWPESISEPSIEIYKDLQDLLLLDPIHGVQPDQVDPTPVETVTGIEKMS